MTDLPWVIVIAIALMALWTGLARLLYWDFKRQLTLTAKKWGGRAGVRQSGEPH